MIYSLAHLHPLCLSHQDFHLSADSQRLRETAFGKDSTAPTRRHVPITAVAGLTQHSPQSTKLRPFCISGTTRRTLTRQFHLHRSITIMSILTKVKKPKKPKQADDQQTDASTPKALTASKPTAPVSSPARASLSRASIDNPNEASKSMYTPQRPSNLRTSSSASVKPLPARPPMARTAASEPNLAARGRISRTSSDLSIDSVMMSRNQNPGPNGHMALQTRQADFKPTMYTYDPSKAPSLAGRKRQYRSCHSHPSTRASSFVRSPHISTMVEENEEGSSVPCAHRSNSAC